MKSLAHCPLWWPELDLDLEKLAKSCTACLSVKQAQSTAPPPMGVAFQILATCGHRLCCPIYGLNIPIVGGCPFQVGWGHR